ncbi:fibronectin type III domain-containing protein [Flavobacterium sp. NRK F7]|uniref:fibronectin type III domain-containing protein n=1 Tax=Flavobacterium sp. NRK F7 TaxID=2954930 RepID=UPI0020916BCB|nr:T9SS sorting signal type C domain-containing protein [Flavobacterium sp. NRK F7]MCO6162687.1 T9SS sorting signal type C domain-containing protein [Flavobacterium sp. NRK F7]
MKKSYLLFLLLSYLTGFSNNDKYRIILSDNPSTTITIAWNQISGTNPTVYYGTTDFGTNWNSYPNTKTVNRAISYRGMNNQFARITGLSANTAYYFVIKDSQGTSQRFWFKTAPNDLSRLSFIAGGDSRNNRTPRQKANKLVAKLKPHAVFFGGDMTDSDNDAQWKEWFDDWQLTIASDGRMFPIIPARGNHEGASTIYNLFDTPTSDSYYAITFGANLIRMYSLNSEISVTGNQNTWLNNDLQNHTNVIWKGAQYHKPMRPHNAAKSEGTSVYNAWAQTFYNNEVRMVIDCDSHTVKSTWPLKPSTQTGNDEGFVRDDNNGTVYLGEGCWGAPLRANDDNKSWTRNSGSFNQFKLIFVDQNKIEARTIKIDNADTVGSVSNSNPFVLPTNLDVWNPSNGAVVEIFKNTYQAAPEIALLSITNGQCYDDGNNIAINVNVIEDGGGIVDAKLYINGNYVASDVTAPYAFNYNFAAGTQTITVVVTDTTNRTASIEKYIYVENFTNTETFSILTGDDDVEEAQDGRLYTDSSDLELTYDSYNGLLYQNIGLRFVNIRIPQGAIINSAYIQFTVDEANSATCELEIAVENTSDAAEYVEALSYGVSSRNYYGTTVSWSPVAWPTTNQSGTGQRTPSLKNLVQYCVNKSNWQNGNAIAFKIKGKGVSLTNTAAKRVADSFEGGSAKAPKLVVSYTYGCNTLAKSQFENQPELNVKTNPNDLILDYADEMESVAVYEITGKLVWQKESILQTSVVIEGIPRKNQVLLIKAQTKEGKSITKKIIF